MPVNIHNTTATSAIQSAVTDACVAVVLIACLIIVNCFDIASKDFGDGGSPASGTTSANQDSSDRDIATATDEQGTHVAFPEGIAQEDETQTASQARDLDNSSDLSQAVGARETPSPHTSADIVASFEAFKPELLPQLPPFVPEVTTQATPPPLEVELLGPKTIDNPQPKKVEFFEIETKAVSVGFVVDCSSSMSGARFQAVCAELAKSIMELKADQQFFVVFFNENFFPMTGNSQSAQLVHADNQHKRAILKFLQSAQSDGGTNPEPALQFMAGLRPDVIYLLTDGEFSPLSPSTYNALSAANIVVHTIGFETGGPVPILQEIAARTSGTFRSATGTNTDLGLLFSDPNTIRTALSSTDPSLRRKAISAVLVRELPFVKNLIAMLTDSDASIRSDVHDELRKQAEGSDFGPSGLADTSEAIERWQLWWSLRKASREKLILYLAGDEPNARWVAASVARTSSLNAPDVLIAAMRTSPAPVWQELHGALIKCCAGQNFGPATDATSEQVVEAANRWAEWRVEERARVARELLEKRIKHAAELLRLAKQLINVNPDAVERRCRTLMKDFADTPSADEARQLLQEIDVVP